MNTDEKFEIVEGECYFMPEHIKLPLVDVPDMSELMFSEPGIITNNTFKDIYISYVIDKLNIMEICKLTTLKLTISRVAVINAMTKHIESIGTDTYIWTQLSKKLEYTFYQFKKRTWPVSKHNNISWQKIAMKIGLVDKVYPGHAYTDEAKKADVKKDDVKKDEADHKPTIDDYKKAMENESLEDLCTIDNDSDDDLTCLIALNDNAKQARRDEKIRTLRLNSNYAVYGIPDIKEINSVIGFTPDDVCEIFEACLKFGCDDIATLFACRLFISRKCFHLAFKSVEFMTAINALMKKHIRLHPLISYCMRYSVYMLLKEERLVGQRISNTNRAILTEDEFRALPTFDQEVDESPYFAEIYCEHNDNLRSKLAMHLEGKRKFTTKEEFNRRFGIMTGNMFDGIDFTEQDAFITGSSLVPCVVTNPLESKFNNGDSFESFVESYYPSYKSITEYEKNYMGLNHLFFDKIELTSFLTNIGMSAFEFFPHKVSDYGNAEFRFNLSCKKC